MQAFFLVFAVLSGVLNTLQSGSNSTLNKRLDQPIVSAVIIYLVGLTLLAITWIGALLLGKGGLPTADRVAQVPWWGWIGGSLGLAFVFGTLLVAPKVGAAVWTAFSITAAVITSVALDHFGWMGFQQHPAGIGRIAGAVLIIGGLGLIAKF